MKNRFCNLPSCLLFVVMMLVLSVCKTGEIESVNRIDPDPGNGDILLPEKFGAVVVADSLGRARHLAVRDNGDIFVHLRKKTEDGFGILALRDTTGDAKADVIQGFSDVTGTGIELHNGYLYYSSRTRIYRSPLPDESLVPTDHMDTLVHLVDGTGHMEKPFTFDGQGSMYVNIGSMSNACQQVSRSKQSPGIDPCIELETRGGIWKFDENELNQQQGLSMRYATGIRNSVALTWNFQTNKLYALQHGRDDLHRFWPEHYTEEQNTELPAEEFLEIEEGDDFGWPYCYWDQFKGQKMLCPEYGGDGETVGRCEGVKRPIYAFPGHWGPNDVLFYQGDMFPEKYKHGAFVAWHGSWNRLGHNQAGFNVVFIPMKDGQPNGDYEIFADGFKGAKPILSPGDALHRPCGLAEGPDGSLYIVDSQVGRVWRIMYYPEGTPRSATIEPVVATVDQTKPDDASDEELVAELLPGKVVYDTYCVPCHMANGKGAPGMNPPLVGTDWVLGEKERIIKVVLQGLSDPVEINGEIYQNAMASHAFLSNQQIADVLTFVRQSWGNDADAVAVEEVVRIRQRLQ